MRVQVFSFVTLLLASCRASPTGAPPAACDELLPGHGVDPQPDPAPYHLMVSTIQPGQQYEFTIMGNSTSSFFKGFLLQAKDPAVHLPVGTFEAATDVRTIDCSGGVTNAATHVIDDEKFMVSVKWTAPEPAVPEVHVVYTVVKQFEEFWVHQHHVLPLILEK